MSIMYTCIQYKPNSDVINEKYINRTNTWLKIHTEKVLRYDTPVLHAYVFHTFKNVN